MLKKAPCAFQQHRSLGLISFSLLLSVCKSMYLWIRSTIEPNNRNWRTDKVIVNRRHVEPAQTQSDKLLQIKCHYSSTGNALFNYSYLGLNRLQTYSTITVCVLYCALEISLEFSVARLWCAPPIPIYNQQIIVDSNLQLINR